MSQDNTAGGGGDAALPIATMQDLQKIVEHVRTHPGEKQKLLENPREALRQAKLRPTPAAEAFITSLGGAQYDEKAEAAKAAKHDTHGTKMGET